MRSGSKFGNNILDTSAAGVYFEPLPLASFQSASRGRRPTRLESYEIR
jgi:hypothetical protein